MRAITKSEALAQNRIQRSEEGATATDFIGRRGEHTDQPMAFLVYNPPRFVTPPHFHDVNQFQLFVEGSGHIGRHAVTVGTLHYAEAGTPYGPIVPGEEGLSYFTFRQSGPGGYYILPGARSLMNRETGRTHMAKASDTGPTGLLFDAGDGLAAFKITVAADATLPTPPANRGAFLVILSGALMLDGRRYVENSCFWIEPDEPVDLFGGPEGAEAIWMTFPAPSEFRVAPAAETHGGH